jgi:hypothetical protein
LAVTTDTVLGVLTPVTAGAGVVVTGAALLEEPPPQPPSSCATVSPKISRGKEHFMKMSPRVDCPAAKTGHCRRAVTVFLQAGATRREVLTDVPYGTRPHARHFVSVAIGVFPLIFSGHSNCR